MLRIARALARAAAIADHERQYCTAEYASGVGTWLRHVGLTALVRRERCSEVANSRA